MYKGENWISYENEKSIAMKVRHKYFKWHLIKLRKVNQEMSFLFIPRHVTLLIKDLLDL
jgi:hypothetical protein